MRSFGGELTREKKKPYRKALSMNSIPTKESTQRTATSTSINAMPTAIMRSLATSLRMSHGMLCNVTELEAVVAKKKSRGRGSHRGSGVGGNKTEAPVRGPRLPVARWGWTWRG